MIYMLRFSCAFVPVNYFTLVNFKLFEPLIGF